MDSRLNQGQRHALTTALRQAEERLRQTESWLAGVEETGTLYQRRLSLDPGQLIQAQAMIDRSLEVIRGLAEEFDLSPATHDLSGAIAAQMTVTWADLVDTESAKLGRYGAVDSRLAGALDPQLVELQDLALNLARLAREDVP